MIPEVISCLLQPPYLTHHLFSLGAEMVLEGVLEATVGLIPHATAEVIHPLFHSSLMIFTLIFSSSANPVPVFHRSVVRIVFAIISSGVDWMILLSKLHACPQESICILCF